MFAARSLLSDNDIASYVNDWHRFRAIMDAAADASPILRTVKVNELVNKPDLFYSYL